jgi:hypothetical protein
MTIILYPVAGDTIPIPFTTYGGTDGESVTMSGLAVTDIEVYKNGLVTQRASDNGYTLLDTDGTDFDGITGLHGFSIDLSDNSDAGFYEVGAWYWVVVSAVTVDSQTVSFVAAMFRIQSPTRGMAGTALPDAAADAAGGLPISDAGGLDIDAMKNKTDQLNFTFTNHVWADIGYIAGESIPAGNLAVDYNGMGYNKTNSSIGTATNVGTVTGNVDGSVASVAGNVDGSVASVTGNVGGSVASVTGNVGGSVASVAGNVGGSVASVAGNVDGNVTGTIGGLSTAAKADVNAEVDSAISDANLAEAAEVAKTQIYAGRLLCIAAGAISNAQNAAEEYVITLDGVTFTVTAAGLDSSGNRGLTAFTEV